MEEKGLTGERQNSLDFLRRIDEKLTWKPELLSKEEEGRVGAMGIASSVEDVEGLVMVALSISLLSVSYDG